MTEYQKALRIETALTAIVVDSPRFAQSCLDPNHFSKNYHHSALLRQHTEYYYCLSKIAQQLGENEEALPLYARYATLSMHTLRNTTLPIGLHTERRHRAQTHLPTDDISVRLPGKYRRMYRYLIENISRRDLSIREAAAHIGVTERAAQLTFKQYLGKSPTQVIRLLRMQAIHEELVHGTGLPIAHVGRKWGIPNRATLAKAFLKIYNCLPSQIPYYAEPSQ